MIKIPRLISDKEWEKINQLKKEQKMKYTWKYCDLCKYWSVECPVCGNRTCNGSSGKTMKENNDCDCRDAYRHFHKFTYDLDNSQFDPSMIKSITIEEK